MRCVYYMEVTLDLSEVRGRILSLRNVMSVVMSHHVFLFFFSCRKSGKKVHALQMTVIKPK